MGVLINKGIEDQIEDEKTTQKLEAMKKTPRIMYEKDKETEYRKLQGQRFVAGKCLPANIQAIKKNDKLAIVGFAPSWKETPWEREGKDMDIWGINELWMQYQKEYGDEVELPFTVWWDVHNPFSPSRNIPKHHEWMKAWKKPIVMQEVYDWIPGSIALPEREIINFFNQNFIIDDAGGSFSDYSNQVSEMIALAIMLGYKEIHVYGVDMAQDSEYAWQRASCQFFLGYAVGAGIRVLMPLTSPMCKCPWFYGRGSDGHNYGRVFLKGYIKNTKQGMQDVELNTLAQEFEFKHQEEIRQRDIRRLEDGLQRTDDELLKLDIMMIAEKTKLEFAKNLPRTMAEIDNKKADVIQGLKKNMAAMAKNKESLEAERKKINSKLFTLKRDSYVHRTVFEKNKSHAALTNSGQQGVLSVCNHILNNNVI